MLAPEILSPVDTFGSTDQSFKSVPRVMRKSSLAVCFIFSLMQWIFYHLLNFWWFLPNYSVLNGEGWWFKSNWPYRLMRFSPNALKKKKDSLILLACEMTYTLISFPSCLDTFVLILTYVFGVRTSVWICISLGYCSFGIPRFLDTVGITGYIL